MSADRFYAQSAGAWQRQKIDHTITDGHSIVAIDADGDGRDEVVVGRRGGERSLIMYTASANGAASTRRVLDQGAWPAPAVPRPISTPTRGWISCASRRHGQP